MKRKNRIAKTRDQKDAEQLLIKLTNKAKRNLSEFWENNKQQFIYNNIAIEEAIKMSVNKNSQEMFGFFWNKALEIRKDLLKSALFIKELVEIYIRIDDIGFMECLLKHIGFSKLINQGKAFYVILNSKNKDISQTKKLDIFKCLYEKVHENNLPEVSQGIEAAVDQGFDDAVLFCLEKELYKPNTKLVKVWENACSTLLERKNEVIVTKVLECIGNKIPNFSYKNVYSYAVKNECQNVARECLNKMNKGGDALKKVVELSKKKFVTKEKIKL